MPQYYSNFILIWFLKNATLSALSEDISNGSMNYVSDVPFLGVKPEILNYFFLSGLCFQTPTFCTSSSPFSWESSLSFFLSPILSLVIQDNPEKAKVSSFYYQLLSTAPPIILLFYSVSLFLFFIHSCEEYLLALDKRFSSEDMRVHMCHASYRFSFEMLA